MPFKKLTPKKRKKRLDAPSTEEPEFLGKTRSAGSLSRSDGDELVDAHNELHVHQVELEMQNQELRRAQQELENSRNRYVDLYDFAPVAYLTFCPGRQGRILDINLAGARLLGKERAYLIGKPFISWLRGEDIRKFLSHLALCTDHSRGVIDLLEVWPPGGGHVPVQLISEAFPSSDAPDELCLRTAIVDLTDRRRVEREQALYAAERSRRAEMEAIGRGKEQFLAILSHELRTPLQSMLSWVEMLKTGRLSPEKTARGLDILEQSTSAQQRLIEDLLDVSRAAAGKIQLHLEPVDFNALLGTLLLSFRGAIEARRIRIILDIDPAVPRIPGDPLRLQQILSNLLANSLKFTPEGGVFHIALQGVRQNGHSLLRFTLRDTGKGIRSEAFPRLFERFSQEDSSTTRKYAGLGLGLSIVKSLVELHGGEVRAESPGENLGTTVTLLLPVSAARRWPAPHSDEGVVTSVVGPTDLTGRRILLVDDDPFTLESLTSLLESSGAAVRIASSVARARELLVNERPDLVISDLALPGEDGHGLIRWVRHLEETRGGGTPAIALSAFASPEERERCLREGFQAFVAKPVRGTELTRVIARILAPSATKAA